MQPDESGWDRLSGFSCWVRRGPPFRWERCRFLLVRCSGFSREKFGLSLFVAPSAQAEAVVWGIRMPRLLLATTVGGRPCLSGAVLQGLLRNNLADPHLLGIGPGAAIGAAIGSAAGGVQAAIAGGVAAGISPRSSSDVWHEEHQSIPPGSFSREWPSAPH